MPKRGKRKGERHHKNKHKEYMRERRCLNTNEPSAFLSRSYDPTELSMLIGDSSTEIPDDVIQAAMNLMEAHCDPNTGPTIGFYSPAELHYYCNISSTEKPSTVPLSRSSINIHHITGHWITSFYNATEQTVYVYDSLMSNNHFEQVKPQLSILYGKHLSETACNTRVTQQGTQPLCGVMAIAFAFCCFLGQNPMNFIFDINRVREHLKNCISTGEVKQFPLLNIDQRVIGHINNVPFLDRNKKAQQTEKHIVDIEKSEMLNKPRTHESNQMTSSSFKVNMEQKKNTKTIPTSDLNTHANRGRMEILLKNYFHDQEQKMTLKRKRSPDPTMEINSDSIVNKLRISKLQDRERKKIKLQNMSPENKKSFNISKSEQMKRLRQNSEYKLQESKRKKEKLKNMTPEQKGNINQQKKQGMKQLRKTNEYKSKESSSKKEKIRKMSEKVKEEFDNKKKLSMKQLREETEYESKESSSKKEKIRKMSEKGKEEFDHKKKLSMKQLREGTDYKSKESSSKKEKIRKMSEKGKEEFDHKKKLSMKQLRERTEYKSKESSSQKEKIRKMSEKGKEEFDHKKKLGMKQLREGTEYKSKESSSQKEKIRKMSEKGKEEFDHKKKLGMKQLREGTEYKSKESSSKKEKIRKMSEKRKEEFDQKKKQNMKQLREKSEYRSKESKHKKDKINYMSSGEKEVISNRKKKNMKEHRQRSTKETKDLLRENDRKRKSKGKHSDNISVAISNFKEAIKDGPNYSCVCCCRFMFRRSVILFKSNRYQNATATLIKETSSAEKNSDNTRRLYICNNCDTSMRKNQMPVLCCENGLLLEVIPQQLQNLSSLELQLISKVLPFMKIVSLYTGAQRSIRGQVVLVPTDIFKVTNSLPRVTSESQIVSLGLKRRLSDKHAFHKQFIRPSYVNNALIFLKNNSKFYSDVKINSQWETVSEQQNKEFWSAITNESDDSLATDTQIDPVVDSEDEIDNDNPPEIVEYLKQKNSINSKTCFQQIHGPNITTDDILNIAPAEGQRPTTYFQEKNWEALAFPKLFPSGKFTFNYQREKTISKKQYFNARVLNKDGRFAETSEYIFHALDILERQTLADTISITTRKSYFQDITAGQLKDPKKLVKLLNQDQVYASFKNIRGTPQYWQQMQFDMLAKLRQFGPYTFFVTGSAAEFHWTEVIQVVARQYGTILSDLDVQNMDWNTKRYWLQRNPVTVARQIDYIFEQLWGKVILSGSHPIGQILNYDRRKEMQGRGTEHFHVAVHVKDAPKIDTDPDEKCIAFINKYISCAIPHSGEDSELYDLVLSRQIHHHTRTCKKNKRKTCRFGYPRPPSPETLIARPPTDENAASVKESAMNIQEKVYKQLLESDPNCPVDLETLIKQADVTVAEYVSSLKVAKRKTTIIMKRMPSEINVNNYNRHILKALRANMDIQFIATIWGCIAYLTSYMCKPERSMSELMRKASKEANDKGIREALAHIGNVFIKSREVSEHEAVARILSLPLRKSNIDVMFIQTDYKENRTRLLKKKCILQNMENDDTDLYVPSIHDKYAHRPDTLENICLADFVANYTLTSSDAKEPNIEGICDENTSSNRPKTVIKLKDNMGKIYRRTKPRVIRYHYISKEKDEEAYYHRLLVLYMPWRNEENIPLNTTYVQRFELVKAEIIDNIQRYEPYSDEVEETLENFDPNEVPAELWDEVSGQIEQEKEDLEDTISQNDRIHLDPDLMDNIDDTVMAGQQQTGTSFTIIKQCLSKDSDFLTNVQALNLQQRQLFDYLFSWATKFRLSSSDTKPEPFYIFLSGGGGVGKTFTINTIYQGLVRALRTPGSDPEKPSVILTASTGKAAANINGTTLHSAFALPVKEKKKKNVYKRPSLQRLNSLRCIYVNLKVIIIDEISMIGSNCLNNLYCVLQDIFQNHTQPFAGLSILAVGDLLQLPPVGDRAIFKTPEQGYEALAGCLWAKLFSIHELTTIVRQQGDTKFAEILSRVRTGEFTDEDIQDLKKLEQTNIDSFPKDTVHLYITNRQVKEYNDEKLALLPGPYVTINSRDTKKDMHTNSTTVTVLSQSIYKTGGLPQTLTIAIGAKFLITKNIDIDDHIVNGVIGTVVAFDIPTQNPLSGTIYVSFSDRRIGLSAKRHSPSHLKHAVPIKAVTARFPLSDHCYIPVERLMYPGVLAYALSSHKSQGSTYQHMIADFTLPQRVHFQQGQAYTMISRATSRTGIKLINFSPDVIKVNKDACEEIERMKKETLLNCANPISTYGDHTVIGHLNIRTLNGHIQDLRKDLCLEFISVLCLTETHTNNPEKLTGFRVLSTPTEHGLAIYLRDFVNYEELQLTARSTDIQAMGVCIQELNLPVVVVYRPPRQTLVRFFSDLGTVVQELMEKFQNIIVVGDFNMPVQTKVMMDFLTAHGLLQTVGEPTHILGGILDLNFTNLQNTRTTVVPVPYTDHHLVCCSIEHNI